RTGQRRRLHRCGGLRTAAAAQRGKVKPDFARRKHIMFESAEIGNAVDRDTFRREAANLRPALLAAQGELRDANFSVVVEVGGVEGAGKSETVNLLLEWLDARGV